MKKRTLALLLALILCVGCAIGGTVAWLITKTDTITTTFTAGNINIELTETTGNAFKFVPGAEIEKNPEVTVKANSENCWLFIEIVETNNPLADGQSQYIIYAIDNGWSAVPNQNGVYYRKVSSSTSDQAFAVLADNKVTVPSSITKEQIDTLGDFQPTLKFTAYAIQSEHLRYTDIEDDNAKAAFAWSLIDEKPTNLPDDDND